MSDFPEARHMLHQDCEAKLASLLDRLQRAEASVDALIRLIYASDDKALQKEAARRLAAWKEGTA